MPLADRITGIQKPFPVGPQATPDSTPATPSISYQQDVADKTVNSFPFDDSVKDKLLKAKYGELDNESDGEVGLYTHKGSDIYNFTKNFLPDKAARFIADKGSFLDPDKIQISRTVAPGAANIDQDQSVMAHEMLHKLFEDSPMGSNNLSKDPNGKAGQAWLSAWDSVKQKGADDPDGDTLTAIDKHLQSTGYNLDDAYSDATERFAYLGQQALQDGIDVIPKELRPYYYGIIKGAPKPTDDQLGSGIPDGGQGFDIDIGDNPDRTAAPAEKEKGPIGKGIDYLLGESDVVNPNAGKLPEPKPAGTIDVPDEYHPALADAESRYPDIPKGIVPAIMMMESSMNTDKRNQKYDLGNYGYLGGITKTGHFADILKAMKGAPDGNYKIKDVPGIDKLATPYAAVQAIASTVAMLKRNHPDLSPEDLYFKLYNAAPKSDTPERRKQLTALLNYYSQSTGAPAPVLAKE